MPNYAVIAPQGLGDCLEATPMIAALRSSKPSATIEVIVLRKTAVNLFEGLRELVDDVVYLPFWEKGVVSFLMACVALSLRKKYDAAFLTFPAARLHYLFLVALVPARNKVMHFYSPSFIRRRFTPKITQIPITKHHNVFRNLALLNAGGIDHAPPTAYAVPKDWIDRNAVRRDKSICFHIGSVTHNGLAAKRWPEANFIALGRNLFQEGYTITVICGPDEHEESQRVASAIPEAKTLSGSLKTIARYISTARVIICNDNGIAHLSAGLGTPTLALFGPTPLEFAPFGKNVSAIRLSTCPPCFDILTTDASCKLFIDHACLTRDLTVGAVKRELNDLMARTTVETKSTLESDVNGDLEIGRFPNTERH